MIITYNKIKFDFSSIIPENEQERYGRILKAIKSLDTWTHAFVMYQGITFSKTEPGINYMYRLERFDTISSHEDKLAFLKIFRFMIKTLEENRHMEKEKHREAQRSEEYNHSLLLPFTISSLYEVRHFIRSLFND